MVAPRQVETPLFKGIGRQRGRGIGSLAQVIGRTSIPFLRKYIVPAAKRLREDLLEFDAPETSDVVSGRGNFNTAGKSVSSKSVSWGGGGEVGDPPCIKIGYSSRLVHGAEKGPQPMY